MRTLKTSPGHLPYPLFDKGKMSGQQEGLHLRIKDEELTGSKSGLMKGSDSSFSPSCQGPMRSWG